MLVGIHIRGLTLFPTSPEFFQVDGSVKELEKKKKKPTVYISGDKLIRRIVFLVLIRAEGVR